MAATISDGDSATEPDDLRDMRVRRDSPVLGARDAFQELRTQLRGRLLSQMEPGLDVTQRAQIRPYVHERLDGLLEERGIVLNRGERRQLLEAIVADFTGA
jgi:hypothetical protein